MYELLLALIVVLFAMVKTKEHLALRFGGNDGWFSTNSEGSGGFEVFNMTPHTCRPEKSDLDAGLCYTPCRAGFRGVGPVCWAISQNVGVGKAVGLEPCPKGWNNDGLICREPIRCASGWDFFKYGCSGGRLRGRLNGGGICDWPEDRGQLPSWLREEKRNAVVYKGTNTEIPADKLDSVPAENRETKNILVATHPDRVDGLCYAKCPADKPERIAGMPYLCYKGGPLSYGRGVGDVPRLFAFANKRYGV